MTAPPDPRPPCLVTAGGPGAAAILRRVGALGWRAIAAPMLETLPVPMADVPPVRAALLTSAAALPSLAAAVPPGTPVLAVGEATAAAARRAGFATVSAAGGDAASLVALVAARLGASGLGASGLGASGLGVSGPGGSGDLLLPVGEGYGRDLAASLRAGGFRVTLRTAYAVREAVALPDAARDALGRDALGHGAAAGAALFLSPRGAATFVRLLREAGLEGRATGLRALALSPRIEGVLSGLRWGTLGVAPRPSLEALLGVLGPGARPGDG